MFPACLGRPRVVTCNFKAQLGQLELLQAPEALVSCVCTELYLQANGLLLGENRRKWQFDGFNFHKGPSFIPGVVIVPKAQTLSGRPGYIYFHLIHHLPHGVDLILALGKVGRLGRSFLIRQWRYISRNTNLPEIVHLALSDEGSLSSFIRTCSIY